MLTREQIQEHIDQLDAQIPKEDAELAIWYPGGYEDSVRDCEIVANYIGYLRFGIEMLKAAVAEPEPGTPCVNVWVDYMEVSRWCLQVRRIIRLEDVRTYFEKTLAAKIPPATWKTDLEVCYSVLLGILVALSLIIGFGEILGWVWHLLF